MISGAKGHKKSINTSWHLTPSIEERVRGEQSKIEEKAMLTVYQQPLQPEFQHLSKLGESEFADHRYKYRCRAIFARIVS